MNENLPRRPEDAIEYPASPDLVATVRSYEPPEGDRGSLSISGCPAHLSWSVESLSGRSGTSQAKTYATLLDLGMRLLWTFPGARELQRAREAIIAGGEPEAIRWIDTWDFDVPTADTGQTIPKIRVPVLGILTMLGKLAKVLGFTKSRTAILALAVALLDDDAVPIQYHTAQAELLHRFARKLRERAAKATEYAARGANASSETAPPRRSLADIIGVRV